MRNKRSSYPRGRSAASAALMLAGLLFLTGCGGSDDDGGEPEDQSNISPVAIDAQMAVDMGQSKALVLSASDSDNDTLNFLIVDGPANGSLSGMAPDIVYQPNEGFSGNDSFTFKANDGTVDSNIATVEINVRAVNDESVAKVFLMSGQSNMVGHGNVNDLSWIDDSLLNTRDDVFIRSIIEPNKSFGPLKTGYARGFGVEMKFGHILGDLLTEDIYLYKASKGGTTVDDVEHWRPLEHGGSADSLYEQMMQGFRDFIQNQLVDKNIDYDIAGFIWFQGFNDANGGKEHRYEGHLRNLLSSVRADLGVAQLPVVIVQMNDARGAASDVVMAAQAKVANEDPLNTLVVTSDQRPYFHYGPSSYVTIGERIAQATLPYLHKPSSKDDEYTVAPNETLNVIAEMGLLSNDVGDNPSVELVSDVKNGRLALASDGGFTYTPNDDFRGQDSFEYRARINDDAGNTAKTTVWVRDTNNPLVLHYDFDNSEGGDVISQLTGFKARIAREGVTFGHQGRIDKAAYFDGKGVLHYLESYPVPALLDLSTRQDFSFALWIKMDAGVDDEQVLISNKYSFNRGPGFALSTSPAGNRFKVYLGTYNHDTHAGKSKSFTATQGDINDGNWHHLAVSVGFSSGVVSLYVNGMKVGEGTTQGLSGDINRYESAIGGGAGGGDGKSLKFKGYVDDVRLYRKALSIEEVQELFNQ